MGRVHQGHGGVHGNESGGVRDEKGGRYASGVVSRVSGIKQCRAMIIIAVLGWITASLLAFRIMRINRSRHLDMLERAGWEAMAFGVIDDYKTHIKHLETERDQLRARLHEGDAQK